jgi:hypothetical protein
MARPARGIVFGLMLSAPFWVLPITGMSELKLLNFDQVLAAIGIDLFEAINF